MATTPHAARTEAGRRVFRRILVGIDGSQQALEAARQAALVQEVDGRLTLLSSWNVLPPIADRLHAAAPYVDEILQRTTAEKALAAARAYVAPYTTSAGKLVSGAPVATLLEQIERGQDTLIAIGSSGSGRLLGIVEGAVATEIVHRASCSVLVARPAGTDFPRRIVVGVDGSIESAAAYAAARYLAERFSAELHALVAWGGHNVNERMVAAITDRDHDDCRDAPSVALVEAATTADLVVVGSRGLHGLRSLGSVSERVAHNATCSALVVREPIWQRVAEETGR